MSKAPANLNLEIDNLVFEGLSGHDARQAAASFETTMTALLSDRGLPKSWQSGGGIDLDLSGFDGAADRPHTMGEALAHFIYHRANR